MSSESASFAALPEPALDIITSYLHITSLIALIKASNRVLLRKLRSGGITTLNVFPTTFPHHVGLHLSFYPRLSFGTPPVPTYNVTSLRVGRFPPKDTFQKLRSLHYQETPYLPLLSPKGFLCDFPPTLTHLDWLMSVHTPLTDENTNFKEWLPDLQSLELRFVFFTSSEIPCSVILSNLPSSLTSLAMDIRSHHKLSDMGPLLPPHLTQLALYLPIIGRAAVPTITPKELTAFLPRSITHLQLPAQNFHCDSIADHVFHNLTTVLDPIVNKKTYENKDLPDLSHWIPEIRFFHPLPLTALNLHSVHPYLRPFLPDTLTSLTLEHTTSRHENIPHTRWPVSLRELTLANSSGLQLCCEASLTRIGVLSIGCNVLQELLVSSRLQKDLEYSGLVSLNFPGATLLESYLGLIPATVKSVTLLDVSIQGQCLPLDLKRLDEVETLVDWFWRTNRHFKLFLKSWKPLVLSYKLWPNLPPKLRSLQLPGHEISAEDLPRRLRKVSHLKLPNVQTSTLPSTLTHLGITDGESKSSLYLDCVLRASPKLKTIQGATFLLKKIHFPWPMKGFDYEEKLLSTLNAPALSSSQASSSAAEVGATIPNTEPAQLLPSIDLPREALQVFSQMHADLELIDCIIDPSELLVSLEHGFPPVRVATFTGPFYISKILEYEGFAPGLVKLDLRGGEFYPRGEYFVTLPRLPTTLRELHLGQRTADQVLYPINKLVISSIPDSVTHLSLRSSHPRTNKDWELPLFPSLHILEIEVEYNPIEPRHIEQIPSHMKSKLAANKMRIVAKGEPKHCNVM